MTNRVTKTPPFRPGKYTALLAKALEDEAKAKGARREARIESQSKSSVSTQMELESALSEREEQHESRHGSKAVHKPDRETELVDSSPYRLQNVRTTGQ